jgi:pimeloyl-ACP methyl ester carboxylesterase
MLRQLAIPIGLITGKESVFYQDTLEAGQDNLLAARASFKPERWHWVDDAAHHVLLDQPRETARLIKVLSN